MQTSETNKPERATETLRSVPENYCLAHGGPGKWTVYRDEHATSALHPLFADIIARWRNGSTSDALADLLGHAMPRQRHAETRNR